MSEGRGWGAAVPQSACAVIVHESESKNGMSRDAGSGQPAAGRSRWRQRCTSRQAAGRCGLLAASPLLASPPRRQHAVSTPYAVACQDVHDSGLAFRDHRPTPAAGTPAPVHCAIVQRAGRDREPDSQARRVCTRHSHSTQPTMPGHAALLHERAHTEDRGREKSLAYRLLTRN